MRRWFKRSENFFWIVQSTFITLSLLGFLASCEGVSDAASSLTNTGSDEGGLGSIFNGEFGNSGGSRNDTTDVAGNGSDSISTPGHGRPLKNNPQFILGSDVSPPVDRRRLISRETTLITNNPRLQFDCALPDPGAVTQITTCMETRQTAISAYTPQRGGKWGYEPNSDEFLEISTFFNARISIEDFLEKLINSRANSITSGDNANSPIPSSYETTVPNYWYSSDDGDTPRLKIYSHCTRPNKPAFYSGSFEVCLGPADNNGRDNFNYSEDLTIVQHEMGHVFSFTMFNARNIAAAPALTIDRRVEFGGDFYSEIDALSEGFSDWYSYTKTGRSSLFDWFGKLEPSVRRPVRENSSLHPNFVAEDSLSRVYYPEFLSFSVATPNENVEDSHLGGQILSHFLIHLEEEMKTVCGHNPKQARDAIFHIIQETLAELGDLTTEGIESSAVSRINMIQEVSDVWVKKNNPPNFRTFSQGFARHFLRNINGTGNCGNNILFGKDRLEQILDDHGLLLFKTYNNDGNNAVAGHLGGNDPVSSLNRSNSELIPKAALKIDDRNGQPSNGYYIIDDATVLTNIVSELVSGGKTLPTELGNPSLVSSTNSNSNSRVSPGEIIAVAVNLFNDSNIPMGGVQILANPWDHVKVDGGETKMCNTFEDGFPSLSEGAASADPVTPVDGDCGFITRENGEKVTEVNETIAPVCFIQKRGSTQTEWVSQSEFKEFKNTVDSRCLMGGDNPDECFFRPIPGADVAWLSKLDPNSNWPETFDPAGAESPTFNAANVLLFEVSKELAPGTLVNCRIRTRFTNCDDCWHDEDNGDDDYLDFEYAGDKPFRIFNLQFIVLD